MVVIAICTLCLHYFVASGLCQGKGYLSIFICFLTNYFSIDAFCIFAVKGKFCTLQAGSCVKVSLGKRNICCKCLVFHFCLNGLSVSIGIYCQNLRGNTIHKYMFRCSSLCKVVLSFRKVLHKDLSLFICGKVFFYNLIYAGVRFLSCHSVKSKYGIFQCISIRTFLNQFQVCEDFDISHCQAYRCEEVLSGALFCCTAYHLNGSILFHCEDNISCCEVAIWTFCLFQLIGMSGKKNTFQYPFFILIPGICCKNLLFYSFISQCFQNLRLSNICESQFQFFHGLFVQKRSAFINLGDGQFILLIFDDSKVYLDTGICFLIQYISDGKFIAFAAVDLITVGF